MGKIYHHYDSSMHGFPSVKRCSELLIPNLVESLATMTSLWEPEVGKDRNKKPRNDAGAVDEKLNLHPNLMKKGTHSLCSWLDQEKWSTGHKLSLPTAAQLIMECFFVSQTPTFGSFFQICNWFRLFISTISPVRLL